MLKIIKNNKKNCFICNKGQNEKICDGQPLYEDCDNKQFWNVAAFILCAAHAMLGLGGSLYWTCGAAYLDDNVRKNAVPLLLGKFLKGNMKPAHITENDFVVDKMRITVVYRKIIIYLFKTINVLFLDDR